MGKIIETIKMLFFFTSKIRKLCFLFILHDVVPMIEFWETKCHSVTNCYF